jgi:predicted DNA-binding protein YlxM (UPF0122 family)
MHLGEVKMQTQFKATENRIEETLKIGSCILTASSISDIANTCNVSYSQVLNHINHCRSFENIEEYLQQFIFRYRPDLYI